MKEEIESLKKFAKLSKDFGQDFFMHPDSAIEMFEHLETLQSRIESLEKDAARYRWLRECADGEVWSGLMRIMPFAHDAFDHRIDTAMQSEKGCV